MKFLEKIEDLLNSILMLLAGAIGKFVPAPLKKVFIKFDSLKSKIISFIKLLPEKTKVGLLNLFKILKSSLNKDAVKTIVKNKVDSALGELKKSSEQDRDKVKNFVKGPFLFLGNWLKGLSATQAVLLLTFTGSSILAVIGIGFSGKRLFYEKGRTPASIEKEVQYARPDYYKNETRHLYLSNFNLPIYFPEVNEIKSVQIEITITLSNRSSRMFMEKNEFKIRDHLIQQIEPSISSFPLEEEGKEIIKQKVKEEINNFMKIHEVEGEAREIGITYILAN